MRLKGQREILYLHELNRVEIMGVQKVAKRR